MSDNLRILLLNDQSTGADAILCELRSAGFVLDWRCAHTEGDFLDCLEPAPDVIISDCYMAQFSAQRALALLKARALDIPCIVVSEPVGEEIAVSLIKMGAADYVRQDRVARLGQAVGYALEQREVRSSARDAGSAPAPTGAWFHALIENSMDGIATVGAQGEMIYASPSTARILGYSVEEFLNSNAFDLIHPDDVEVVNALRAALLAEPGITKSMQVRKQHKDGTWLWIETTACNLLADPDVRAITFNYRDITERMRAEEELRRSEELFTKAFRASPDAFIITRLSNNVLLDVNDSFARMVGYGRDEAVGQTITELNIWAEAADRERMIALVRADGSVHNFETPYRKKSGEQGYSLVSSERVQLGGEPCMLTISRDITERKQAEDALRTSEQKFRAVFDSVLDAIFIIDHQGRFLEVNPAAALLTGFSQAELSQHGYEDYSNQAQATDLKQLWQQLLREGAGNGEIAIVGPDGRSTQIEYYSKADFLPGLHLAIVRDITERKQAAAAYLAKEAAEQANQAKSEFLSRMSHELRTPLNAIIGFSHLLETDDLDIEQRESVGLILKAGRHLLTLINEVLDISRVEAGAMSVSVEPVLLAGVLEECINLVRPMAAQNSLVIRVVEPAKTADDGDTGDTGDAGDAEQSSWYVMADRQRITQIMLNLLSNAIKYNRAGGSVLLSCQELDWGRMRIEVRDTGCGIAQDKLEKLFTPFERLGADQTTIEGTGLGLVLSKHLAELMGGDIGVVSKVGEGCTFWLELPRVTALPEHITEEAIESAILPGGTQASTTLLYIDNNPSNHLFIEHILKYHSNSRLLSAMQGRLGFELATLHQPDLILLDLHLPDVHGKQVLEWLRADPRTGGIPVIIVSADAAPHEIERLLSSGARAYITKPIDVKQLLATIQLNLEGRQLVDAR